MGKRRRQLPAWEAPVLTSVVPVVESARHVTVDPKAIDRVAAWMAYEDFDTPPSGPQFDVRYEGDDLIDWTMINAALNFAFTDFETAERFDTTYLGNTWADSEAMYACFDRAITEGIPVLDGSWMASVTRPELNAVFDGTIEIPMLDERVSILNEMGATLVDRYDGRFHTFVHDCEPAMYCDGNGLLERLIAEFPRFDDVSLYDGHKVHIHKLAQLGLWSLHRIGAVPLDDIAAMSAFADYIVPVALRAMGILTYTEELAAMIDSRTLIPRDSTEEIELRASSLWATADLTEAVNALRPDHMQLVIPEIDYRLWSAYHASFAPHHLTRTIMY
ncbi:MAG: queuosine salvage family protein [Acidimicrobiia bacterium]|nr:queuosine salvage family protein [Acidimicrobiia bacterium]